MIRKIICFFKGHRWIFFSQTVDTQGLPSVLGIRERMCKRCGKFEQYGMVEVVGISRKVSKYWKPTVEKTKKRR